jgi:DNA-binding CsgD family transcriptional regulator
MAASGSSNVEIAQALFVTVKTVEMHLTRIYRKLEIRGRSALAAALTQPTATPGPMSRVAPVARENEQP